MKKNNRSGIFTNILTPAVENAIGDFPVHYIVEDVIKILESENFPINEFKNANEEFKETLHGKVESVFGDAFEGILYSYLIADLASVLAEVLFDELESTFEENSVELRNDKIQAWINSRKNTTMRGTNHGIL
jgi:hypothetical protein